MKVIVDADKIIVFLSKNNIRFNLEDENELKKYLADLILKLNNKLDLNDNSFYNIDVYYDNYYGYILEITGDNNYYNYFSQIDMQVNIIKGKAFLYEIDYCFISNDKVVYYKNGSKIYLKLVDKIDDILLGKIIECSKIIYGKEINDIIRNSEKVNYEETSCSISG